MAKAANAATVRVEAPKPKGRLWFKLLRWFLVVSLVPLLFLGSYLIRYTRASLKQEALKRQSGRAISFSNFVYDYINTYKSVLFGVANMEGFAELGAAQQESTFNRLMQLHPPLLELSVLDPSGREMVRVSRFERKGLALRDLSRAPAFNRALHDREYMGSLERYAEIYPTMLLAMPIMDPTGREPRGVLLGKINLNGLSQMLQQWFKDSSMEGALVGPNGFLVAHSDLTKVFRADAQLPQAVLDVVLTRPEEKGGGELTGETGKLLGAWATVKDLGWVVYTQEPIAVAYGTAAAIERQGLLSLIFIVIGTILVSFVVASSVAQPIRSLKDAATRLSQGQFDGFEVTLTNDEIGDLGQTFLVMSESLKAKTEEILSAKQEVEKLNRTLENRVESRTRELKAAQDELISKARLAAIGEMASVVGHEIRNPLAVINNSVYFIKTKLGAAGEVDAKVTKHIAIIESEIKQANGIINEILTYSRSRELKPALININDFLEELTNVYPFPPHVQLAQTFTPENPAVMIDPDEMRQAVRNLIGNGVEVMPTSGTVRLATEMAGKDWVRIDVGDSGSGIPPEVVEKIFTPFFTTKARGTGLGLAVVRKVVDRHKGKIEVDSVVGKGTTFKIYLPLATRPGPSIAAASAQTAPAAAAPAPKAA